MTSEFCQELLKKKIEEILRPHSQNIAKFSSLA